MVGFRITGGFFFNENLTRSGGNFGHSDSGGISTVGGLHLGKDEWSFVESFTEVGSDPRFFIDIFTPERGDVSAFTLVNSEETNGFSIWMFTHGFLFLKFKIEVGGVDSVMSSDNGITTVFSLNLGEYSRGGIEFFFEVYLDPIGVHFVNGTDDHFSIVTS